MKRARTPAIKVVVAGALMIMSLAAFGQKNVPPPPPSESVLIEVLRSNADLQKKSEACRMLGQVGTRAAVAVLAGLLGDDQLSDRARYALEQIPDPSVVQALRDAIPSLKGRHLAGALMSLGARSTPAASGSDVKLVGGFIGDGDAKVAGAAIYALAKIGTPAAAKQIEQALDGAPDALKAELWDGLLRSAATLTERGQTKEAAAICDRLVASEAPIHIKAAAARGSVVARKGPASGPLLVRLLQDKDEALFVIGLELAQEAPGAPVTRAIVSTLPKLDARRQALLIEALGSRGDSNALPAIRAAAGGKETEVRVAAFSAIARMGDVTSLPLLVDAAATSTDIAEAKAALVKLSGKGVDEALIQMAGGADSAKALVAIEILARRQAPAVPALFKISGEKTGGVKLAALKALGDLAATSDVPALLDAHSRAAEGEELETIEQSVIKTCGRADDSAACADAVAGRVGGAKPAAKVSLLRVLTSIGGNRSLQAIRTAAKDSDADVRDTAIRALTNWPSHDVAPDLLQIARTSPVASHKLLAVRGFLRLAGDENLPADRKLAMSAEIRPLMTRDDEKRQWVGAVGSTSTLRALELLAPMVDDAGVSEEACAAVAAVAGKVLRGPDSTKPDVKEKLTAIAALLAKCREKATEAKVKSDIEALEARVRELRG